MRYTNNKVFLKGPNKLQSVYSNLNQPAVNGTRNSATQAPVKPASNVKTIQGTYHTLNNSTINYNSTANRNGSKIAHNSTSAAVSSVKTGTFKFGNSSQVNYANVTVNSTTIPVNFSDTRIHKLKTVHSKQDDFKQHQLGDDKSQEGRRYERTHSIYIYIYIYIYNGQAHSFVVLIIYLAGFSKRLSTVTSPVFRVPPPPSQTFQSKALIKMATV